MKRNFEDIEDISQRIHTIPEELPVLPVRDAVIFPNAVIPLNVGRDSSVKLINDVQQLNGMLVVLIAPIVTRCHSRPPEDAPRRAQKLDRAPGWRAVGRAWLRRARR